MKRWSPRPSTRSAPSITTRSTAICAAAAVTITTPRTSCTISSPACSGTAPWSAWRKTAGACAATSPRPSAAIFTTWQQSAARRTEQASEGALSLDFKAIEDRYHREKFSDADTPDLIFERKWATEMLHHVIEKLGETYQQKRQSPALRHPSSRAGKRWQPPGG